MYEKADEFGRRMAYTITMVQKSFCGTRKWVQNDKLVKRLDGKRLSEFKQHIYNSLVRVTA